MDEKELRLLKATQRLRWIADNSQNFEYRSGDEKFQLNIRKDSWEPLFELTYQGVCLFRTPHLDSIAAYLLEACDCSDKMWRNIYAAHERNRELTMGA